MAVTRLEIRSREPYEQGQTFGDTGAYERIDGTLHFAVDPLHAANSAIVDLDKAARDALGRVQFSADFCLLQPADPARGNRRLLFDVLNRGNKTARRLNRSVAPLTPTDRFEPGDGFLFRHGWTIAWCGWQWDVVPGPGMMALLAPEALNADGQPLAGEVAIQFQPNEQTPHRQLGHSLGLSQMRPYPVADIDQADATLSVREHPDAPRTSIPRARWRFAREVGGHPVADDSCVWLEGGFAPGKVYELIYRTRVCPVVGAGLLATRDAAAFLRHSDAAAGNPCAGRIDCAIGFGVSQTGRFLRHFLSLGLNVDEGGRQVFDGLLPEIAGARRGEFNNRYGQPSVAERPGFGYLPPFAFSAPGGGLLDRQQAAGGMPKVITTNTAAEYWGMAGGSLIHTDIHGERDLEPPENVRIYAFAGTMHVSNSPQFMVDFPAFTRGGNGFNAVDYSLLTRAALVNLDRWVSAGVEPPPSAFPRLADGTAQRADAILTAYAAIPGVALPDPALLPVTPALDLGPEAAQGIGRYPAQQGAPYPRFVSAVDADGNEVAGVRLPELTQPVATYTGWNPRHAAVGGAGQLVLMAGSTLPFAATAAERQRNGDPRPAIGERYRDRDDYAARVRADAVTLAAHGYLLEEDIDRAVRNALVRYDAFAAEPAGRRS